MAEQVARVVLVEDNPYHAELVMAAIEDILSVEHVTHLTDGEAAIEYFRRCSEEHEARPDLILLDLRLPKVDGIEVLRALKSDDALRSIPAVVLSSSDARRDIERAYENHANSYIVKPLGFDSLQSLIGHIITYWWRYNRSPA